MFEIEVGTYIKRMIAIYHVVFVFISDEATVYRKYLRNILFASFVFFFPFTMLMGALKNESRIEMLYLATLIVIVVILSIKAWYAYYNEKDIISFINGLCVHSIADEAEHLEKSDRLRAFRNFAVGLFAVGTTSMLSLIFACIYDNSLPIQIWFPLNWRENRIYFWMAYCFVIVNTLMALALMQFTVLIWYIMLNCAIKYQILGNRLRQMGQELGSAVGREEARNRQQDLIGCIRTHYEIRMNIEQFRSFFSSLFAGQITTGGISICLSVFLLSFGWSGNIFKYISYVVLLVYAFFDIFVVMFLGNEILIANQQLPYCLFESNWIAYGRAYQKNIIIFMDIVQPRELVIAKMYPLNLSTFMSVVQGAYSMFNLLQNL